MAWWKHIHSLPLGAVVDNRFKVCLKRVIVDVDGVSEGCDEGQEAVARLHTELEYCRGHMLSYLGACP